MFLEFYNLKEQPFGVTPDPRFLYLGENHREALASLYYGIESDRGSIFLFCERSKTDPQFPKYPRLPVLRCAGYVHLAREGKP